MSSKTKRQNDDHNNIVDSCKTSCQEMYDDMDKKTEILKNLVNAIKRKKNKKKIGVRLIPEAG